MSRTTTGVVSEKKEISIFISYAHQDEKYRNQLELHLGFLKKSKLIKSWHDRKIMPGQEWQKEIDNQLNLADIILLLITPAFASSAYCWDVEVKRALERRGQGDTLVVPVIIQPVVGWEDTPLGKLQALPKNAKAVTLWKNHNEAFYNIAEGLREILKDQGVVASVEPDWRYWYLELDEVLDDFSEERIVAVTAQLSEVANSDKLEYVNSSHGTVDLLYRSTQDVFEELKASYSAGKLQDRIEYTIKGLRLDPGAVMRIESRIVHNEYQSKIHYLPEMFGGRSLEEGFPPLVGGISFPLNNPLQIGFSLLTDASKEIPTEKEQAELQVRLGRYLNTFLVLSGEYINVTLTPMDEYCGLPKLLRNTELGRDMLSQDVVLKHYVASQLHPSTAHGKAFWDEVDNLVVGHQAIESCFRVWILPDNAGVREKTEDIYGHVTLEKLGLKVMCEADYDTLQQFRQLKEKNPTFSRSINRDQKIVEIFKRLIIPIIQQEVSTGPRFGLLRQILSILIIAKWIMESKLGEALKKAGFLGSNSPERYGLNTVNDDVLFFLKRLYMQLFGNGIWQYSRTRFDIETSTIEKRLYVAGGIDLDQIRPNKANTHGRPKSGQRGPKGPRLPTEPCVRVRTRLLTQAISTDEAQTSAVTACSNG